MTHRSRLFLHGAAVIALLLSSQPADAARPPGGRAIDRLPEIRAAVAKTRDAADPSAGPGDRRASLRTLLAQGNWWNQWSNLWRNF